MCTGSISHTGFNSKTRQLESVPTLSYFLFCNFYVIVIIIILILHLSKTSVCEIGRSRKAIQPKLKSFPSLHASLDLDVSYTR